MKYKEFKKWCNERAADGMWAILTAMKCIEAMRVVDKCWFWKRDKIWREHYEAFMLATFVKPTNKFIEQYNKFIEQYKKSKANETTV